MKNLTFLPSLIVCCFNLLSRVLILVELKFLVFINSKKYFIYFNTPLYNSPNINDFIFLSLYLNILSLFKYSLSLSLSLSQLESRYFWNFFFFNFIICSYSELSSETHTPSILMFLTLASIA